MNADVGERGAVLSRNAYASRIDSVLAQLIQDERTVGIAADLREHADRHPQLAER